MKLLLHHEHLLIKGFGVWVFNIFVQQDPGAPFVEAAPLGRGSRALSCWRTLPRALRVARLLEARQAATGGLAVQRREERQPRKR